MYCGVCSIANNLTMYGCYGHLQLLLLTESLFLPHLRRTQYPLFLLIYLCSIALLQPTLFSFFTFVFVSVFIAALTYPNPP